MEFSWNYRDTMNRLGSIDSYFLTGSDTDAKDCLAYSAMLKFDICGEGCEVPTGLLNKICGLIPTTQEEVATIVVPLYTSRYTRTCSGADTILKSFVRDSNGRINKVITPKGEVYYGNNGIILDGDMNPLFLSTALIHYSVSENRVITDNFRIHLHPNVFTDDTKLINKALAKKGIAYYLTHTVDRWRERPHPYNVVIDDCSQFIVKAKRPDVNHSTPTDFNKVLKDNIDEVLRQVAYDSRGSI